MTGNTKLEVEGMVQQAKGKVENAWGKTKDAIRSAVWPTQSFVQARLLGYCTAEGHLLK
jgi:hypothetical protein